MYHRQPPRLAALLLALFVPVLLVHAPVAHAADAQCFQETGQCISGPFQSYWQANGGLPVFGFPITAPADELNRDTGQTYSTQWFERNRLEIHPENAAPYNVLLGRLGDDRLRQEGRDWRTFPKADPSSPHYYAATGHAIAPQFWSYWRTHGLELGDPAISERESLALFGLPLSEPAMETNSSGDTVLTQWFERARFEYYPDMPAPYIVLLGLLGDEIRAARTPQIITKTASVAPPAVAGHYVFWDDIRNQPAGTTELVQLYGRDLDTKTEFLITPSAVHFGNIASDGATFVWEDQLFGNQAHDRITGYNLQTKQTFTILETSTLNVLGSVAMSNGVLYYVDNSTNHRGIFARTVATGQEHLVSSAMGSNLVVGDGTLLWSDTQGCQPTPCLSSVSLHLFKLNGTMGTDVIIAKVQDENGFSGYDVSGDHVVWSQYGGPVHLYSVSRGTTADLPTVANETIFNPVVGGDHVVWSGAAGNPNWTLRDYRIATNTLRAVNSVPPSSVRSAGIMASNILVYSVQNGQGSELFMVNLE